MKESLPIWTPQCVSYALAPHQIEVQRIRNLLFDERMKVVWRYILTLPVLNEYDASGRDDDHIDSIYTVTRILQEGFSKNEMACADLAYCMFRRLEVWPYAVHQGDIDRQMTPYKAAKSSCEELLQVQRTQSSNPPIEPHLRAIIDYCAKWIDRNENLDSATILPGPGRSDDSDVMRVFVREAGWVVQYLYGKRLYSKLGTITSIAFQTPHALTFKTIENWCNSPKLPTTPYR